ncbi:uncharacterized protein [Arachis hypogaea]|uniref:uncharacterized protein n=1 Tax=Arachis hypogaea TaxID=3818 RepID=UPI003B226727
MNQEFVKLDRFDGTNFNRWKDKMMFLLSVLKLAYVIDPKTTPIVDAAENVTPEEKEKIVQLKKKRDEDTFACRGHILNTLSDRLYDLYMSIQSPLEIWKFLEEKKKLLHLGEDFTIEKLLRHIRIEEETRKRDAVYLSQSSKVNHIDENNINKKKRKFSKDSKQDKKRQRECYHCHKKGHYIKECRLLKKEASKTNLVEEKDLIAMVVKKVQNMHIGMVTEVNIATQGKSLEWWLDSGATVHVCNDRNQFKTYEEVNNREVLMGNDNSAKVCGQGSVELNFTSEKKLSLINVLHVPDLRKNLVSVSLLCKKGFKVVMESDKVILLKHDVFIGKGYCTEEGDPQMFKEAMASRDSAFWKEVINDEMDSILSNNTWVLVDLPPGSKPIGCKWVFRRKYNTDGSLQTFKARLVAKGFRQQEGLDYFDTYAPVARMTSIRALIALASIHKLHIHQIDVKTAFLNGDLNEEIYVEQLEGYVLPGNEKKMKDLNEVDTILGIKVHKNEV